MGTGILNVNGTEVTHEELLNLMKNLVASNISPYHYSSPTQRVIPGESKRSKQIIEKIKKETGYEKVNGDIIGPNDPEYQKIIRATMKDMDDFEDCSEILDPSSELKKFGPKTEEANGPVTLLTNDQVSDLFHRVNTAVYPKDIERSRCINLVAAVLLYISQSIKPELLFQLCRNTDDMVTVNSICKFFSGFIVFTKYDSDRPMVAIADKEEVFKIISETYSFFREIERNTSFKCCNDIYGFLETWMKDNFSKNGIRVDINDGKYRISMITPFEPIIPGISAPDKHTPTKSTINKIKTELSKISGGVKCEAVANGDLVYVSFFIDGLRNNFYIDPGVLIGNGYNMFCNIPGDTILVNFKHKDIIKKTIFNPSYILTIEEIKEVQKDMFMNESIYYRIDMSNMPSISIKLSDDELATFGKKLSAICTINFAQFGLPYDPRLRIKSFTNLNNFTLVSDKFTYSALIDRRQTASQIVHGLELKVKGNEVYLSCPTPNGELFTCTFEINYGIM